MINPYRPFLFIGPACLIAFWWFGSGFVLAQPSFADKLGNGGMEKVIASQRPADWNFTSRSQGKLSLDFDKFREGKKSALIDTTEADVGSGNLFSNLSQTVNGEPYRGKRVRFRAAVCTAALEPDAKAQLWFRVDRKSVAGERVTGAFDNMQNRPIQSDQWNDYEIVLPVDDDADKIIVGMFVLGRGKAWIDDATFEIVDPDTPTTASATTSQNRPVARRGFSSVLMKAFEEAESAPQQPLLTLWLWLVVVALTLFALSAIPPKEIEVLVRSRPERRSVLGWIPRFALRFSFAYWLLYSFPKPFTSLLSYLGMLPLFGLRLSQWGMQAVGWYSNGVSKLVHWTSLNVFGIEGELVPLNGSGDTTFAYINIFVWFVLSLGIALIWSLVDWRKTDYRITKDLLRSYLRYVIAFSMLGYGLSKVGWAMNQFPEPGIGQLLKSYGDASPMNLLWTFMGASRPYTQFAGMGEVVGALLLIWRRTSTLGALVVFGVMLNVMMLNFCYDIPVKIYSFHLVCMALYLLLPEFGRLGNVLLWNRSTGKTDFRPPYTGPVTIWIQRTIKALIIITGFAIPIYSHVQAQFDFFANQSNLPDFFGRYEVEEFKLNGIVVPGSERDDVRWFAVEFNQKPYSANGSMTPSNWLTIVLPGGGSATATFSIVDSTTLTVSEHGNPLLPQQSIQWKPLDNDRMLISGKIASGELEVKLLRRGNDLFRLTGRGFRWINEVPFNR